MDGNELKDKVAIVTGAGRGIGRAIAIAYAEAGAKVVCAARSVDEITTIADEVDGLAIPCDVSSEQSIQTMINGTIAEFGRSDNLGNNAGAVAGLPTHHMHTADWHTVTNGNPRDAILASL